MPFCYEFFNKTFDFFLVKQLYNMVINISRLIPLVLFTILKL